METKQIQEQETPTISDLAVAQRRMWYERVFILFEMCNYARGRETCFLSGLNRFDNVRNMNCGKVDYLMKMMGIQTRTEKENNQKPSDAWHFFTPKKNYHVYSSLAIIDWANCPLKVFSYAHTERKKQQAIMKEKAVDYMIDFTGGIDFDGDQNIIISEKSEREIKETLDISQEESVDRALKDLKVVIKLFNKYGFKWWTQFSGGRGFHLFFEVPFDDITINQKVDLINLITQRIYKTFDLKTIDRIRLNTRKVFKTPYSLTTKNDKSLVVLPLEDSQIENFSLKEVELSNVLHKLRIKDRGCVWRNLKLDKNTLRNNIKKFMDDFEINMPEHKEY